MNDSICALEQLGFTNYEAKTYVALLTIGSGTGYQAAKAAGVPTSKVYQALASLIKKGAVAADNLQDKTYRPTPPKRLLGKIKSDTATRVDGLIPELDLLRAQPRQLKGRMVSGFEQATEVVCSLISGARRKLIMTAWAEDLERLAPDLTKTAERASVTLLSYEAFDSPQCRIFTHRRLDLVRAEFPGRMLLGTADAGQAVVCFFQEDGGADCIWTSSPGVVRIIADHILHDISLNILLEQIPDELKAACENKLAALRRDIHS